MNARRITEAVTTSAETLWAPLSAAAKKATNFSQMKGHAKVSRSQLLVTQFDFCISPAVTKCCGISEHSEAWNENHCKIIYSIILDISFPVLFVNKIIVINYVTISILAVVAHAFVYQSDPVRRKKSGRASGVKSNLCE